MVTAQTKTLMTIAGDCHSLSSQTDLLSVCVMMVFHITRPSDWSGSAFGNCCFLLTNFSSLQGAERGSILKLFKGTTIKLVTTSSFL